MGGYSHERNDRARGLALIVGRYSGDAGKTATEAGQGRTSGVVLWVLGISLTLAIVAMIIAFFVS
jgi:hypothetical protein